MSPRVRKLTRIAALVVATLVVWLQWDLWTGRGGIPDVDRLEQRVAAQRTENAALLARNRALAADVEDLKRGREAIEERARDELGMVASDEVFYQVVEGGTERAPAVPPERR
jgi:cell division protein FtsB